MGVDKTSYLCGFNHPAILKILYKTHFHTNICRLSHYFDIVRLVYLQNTAAAQKQLNLNKTKYLSADSKQEVNSFLPNIIKIIQKAGIRCQNWHLCVLWLGLWVQRNFLQQCVPLSPMIFHHIVCCVCFSHFIIFPRKSQRSGNFYTPMLQKHTYLWLTNCRFLITVCALLNFDIIKWQLGACIASVFVIVTLYRWPLCKQFTCSVTGVCLSESPSADIMSWTTTVSAIKLHWTVI